MIYIAKLFLNWPRRFHCHWMRVLVSSYLLQILVFISVCVHWEGTQNTCSINLSLIHLSKLTKNLENREQSWVIWCYMRGERQGKHYYSSVLFCAKWPSLPGLEPACCLENGCFKIKYYPGWSKESLCG